MKFKVGDKVRVKKNLIVGKDYGWFSFVETMEEHMGKVVTIYGINLQAGAYDIAEDGGEAYWTDEMLEPIEDPLAQKVLERNNKPSIQEQLEENLLKLFDEDDKVNSPSHYTNNGKDLFDELYDRLFHSKKMFTGREVFIIVMKFVAERYIRRYPNKNEEDLQKGIYTLERLKEYEEACK